LQDFNKLAVWRRAHSLTLDVYRQTENFPRGEMFGLTSQLRRASASIAANLAEGSGRTQVEFGRFVQIALGSACEVEYHVLLARDLSYLSMDRFYYLTEEVRAVKRMLTALLKTVRARQAK
jgi:four helix bundle protein